MNNYKHVFKFANGFGASVICNDMSYGGKNNLFEVAVLDKDGDICYDSPITNDVVGWCSFEDVANLLKRIEELP